MVAAGNPLGGVRSYLADEFDFTAPDCPGLHFMGAIADSSLLSPAINRYVSVLRAVL
jgi:hypothetical protein